MKTMIVLVGMCGTGKSTLVNSIQETYKDSFVYSTDNLIEAWAEMSYQTYDDIFDQSIKKATQSMEKSLTAAFSAGKDIIWDQTNLGAKKRAKIIRRAREHGYHCYCYSIDLPKPGLETETLIARLKGRKGKTIPGNILKSMVDNYVQPDINEGFEMVRYFDMHGNIMRTVWN